MGQAKRKRLGPCLCGGGRAAIDCCWTPAGYHKRPAALDLHNTGLIGNHQGCYMQATNGCDTQLSAEHLISEAVLNVLAEKQIEVMGLPWQRGTKKMLRFGSLTARNLCTRHNSLLSPIDAAGAKFFEAIQSCGTSESAPALRFLLSGHDIERWMLRTLAIFGVSGNFVAKNGANFDQTFIDQLRIVDLLERPGAWVKPMGFYVLGEHGHQFTQRADVPLAVAGLMRDGQLVGMTLVFQGFGLGLIADHDLAGSGYEKAFYRPGSLIFDTGSVRHQIELSWDDGAPHPEVTLTWDKPA